MANSDISEAFYNTIAQTSEEPMGLEIAEAAGPYLITTDGKKYLDMISGIAVSSLGHRHPKVVDAVKKQIDRHMHVMVYGEFIQKPQSELAQLLTRQLPPSLDRVYFTNSGTEANEGALKLAKKHTGRHQFVAFKNSYHGDTHGSLSVTGRAVYQEPYKPLLPGVTFLDFNEPDQFQLINEDTAAVIMEPIQGEGGIVPADGYWLNHLRQRCDDTGALLIFDEIQTGFGRTGHLFGFMHYGIIPDIICFAKALGGGMPLGAFVSSSEIFEVFKYNPPLNHVTTFGGHPVSCAAAYAALKELLEKEAIYLKQARKFETIARNIMKGNGIKEVRGKGAMLGLELTSAELTQKVVEECLKQRIILGWTLHSNTLIRIAPPLILETELFEEILQKIKNIIHEFYNSD